MATTRLEMALIGVALIGMALINRRKLASLIGVLVLLPAWGYAQQAEVSEANLITVSLSAALNNTQVSVSAARIIPPTINLMAWYTVASSILSPSRWKLLVKATAIV